MEADTACCVAVESASDAPALGCMGLSLESATTSMPLVDSALDAHKGQWRRPQCLPKADVLRGAHFRRDDHPMALAHTSARLDSSWAQWLAARHGGHSRSNFTV